MADDRYFYWYRNTFGRWSPCIASDSPGKGPQSRAPTLAFPAIKLSEEQLHLSLDECKLLWPSPDQGEMCVLLSKTTEEKTEDDSSESQYYMWVKNDREDTD